MKPRAQSGFHIVEILILVAVVGLISFVGWRLIYQSGQQTKSSEVKWAFNTDKNKWFTENGTAPTCREPFTFDRTPIDISQVTAVLLPGAYRGYSYKPHGGFGTPESLAGKVDIKMPMDATLVGLTRYYEGSPPDLQYLLTFESDCGIAFRFDHIYTLTPGLQALADKTPAPKLNDTRTNPSDNPPRTKFKSGQTIATQVGLPSMKIYGFDFGVYDYRQQNEISKNPAWAALHSDYESLDWFGVCWFDMLPGSDPEIIKPLSLAQTDTRRTVRKTSDYCSIAPYTTLDTNNGKPTDG